MKRLFLLLAALLLTFPATAHQQKVSISTIEQNPRTGLIEVTHRILLHDAEHALRHRGISAADIIDDRQSRRTFARYVEQSFSLSADGKPVDLTLLGSEIEGGHIYVYQTAPALPSGTQVEVQARLFTEIWLRQVNRVNVGKGERLTTLVFSGGDRPKTAVLP